VELVEDTQGGVSQQNRLLSHSDGQLVGLPRRGEPVTEVQCGGRLKASFMPVQNSEPQERVEK
jgi:hypothetical protein